MTHVPELVDAAHVYIRPAVQARTSALTGRRSYVVKWAVASAEKSRSSSSKAEANRMLRDLARAKDDRERFDRLSGLPVSMLLPSAPVTLLSLSMDEVASRWATWSPGNRKARVEALAQLCAHFTAPARDAPPVDLRRRVARDLLLPPPGARADSSVLALRLSRERGRAVSEADCLAAVRWLEAHSRPVSQLSVREVEKLLEQVGRTRAGAVCAPDTRQRQRTSLSIICRTAVKDGLLTTNPVREAEQIVPDDTAVVDPAYVPTVEQCREMVREVGRVDDDEDESWSIFLEMASRDPAGLLLYCRDLLAPTLERSKELVRLPEHEFNERNDLLIITRLEGLVELAVRFLEGCSELLEASQPKP